MDQKDDRVTGDLHSRADERLRALICVKLHQAAKDSKIQGKRRHRLVLKDAFAAADADGDGRLLFDEFASTAAALGLGVSERDLRAAFMRFDTSENGSISASEFIAFLCPEPSEQDLLTRRNHCKREVAEQQFERLVVAAGPAVPLSVGRGSPVDEALRRIAQGIFSQEINLRQAFHRFDVDGSGGLSASEFTALLNEVGFSVDLNTAEALFHTFDINADEEIALWELCRTLGGLVAPPTSAIHSGGGLSLSDENKGTAATSTTTAIAWEQVGEEEEESLFERNENARLQREALWLKESLRECSGTESTGAKSKLHNGGTGGVSTPSAEGAMCSTGFSSTQRSLDSGYGSEDSRDEDFVGSAANTMTPGDGTVAAALGQPERQRDPSDARFLRPTPHTEIFERGTYAWSISALDDTLSDEEILRHLRKRLRYVRASATEALAQCVRSPSLTVRRTLEDDARVVDADVLVAFAGSLLYSLSAPRAARLLRTARGAVGALLPIRAFLALFGEGADRESPAGENQVKDGGSGTGVGGRAATAPPSGRRRRGGYRVGAVDQLTPHERSLLPVSPHAV